MLHSTLLELDEPRSWWCTVESIRHSLTNASNDAASPLDLERLSTFSLLLRGLAKIGPDRSLTLSIGRQLPEGHLLCPPFQTLRMKTEIEKSDNFRSVSKEGGFSAGIGFLCKALDEYVAKKGSTSIGMKERSALADIANRLSETAQALLYEPQE
jgi:hypothetical protein